MIKAYFAILYYIPLNINEFIIPLNQFDDAQSREQIGTLGNYIHILYSDSGLALKLEYRK